MRQIESSLQQSCVKWFDLQHGRYKMLLYSHPNEGARTIANGARMKAQGRRAGVADMFFAFPNSENHGLYIEFKTDKGKQNENQINFELAVKAKGYGYVVVRSFGEFKEVIEKQMNLIL